jgi:hypothetical protein
MTRSGILNDNYKVDAEPAPNDKEKDDSPEKAAMKNLG